MRARRLSGLLMAAALATSGPAAAQEVISRTQLEQMFASMRAEAPWDVDGPLLWGFYFTGERDRIASASDQLEELGYRLVEVREVDLDVWLLHVEKVEHHTVDSLAERNTELYAFARRSQLAAYDGMDVGPVEQTAD